MHVLVVGTGNPAVRGSWVVERVVRGEHLRVDFGVLGADL